MIEAAPKDVRDMAVDIVKRLIRRSEVARRVNGVA
jgi:hypothetical protein